MGKAELLNLSCGAQLYNAIDYKISAMYEIQGREPTSQSRDKNIETGYNLVKFQSCKRHFRAVNRVFIYFMLCLMRKWQAIWRN